MLEQRTYTLGDAQERLEEQLDNLAEQYQDATDDAVRRAIDQTASELDKQGVGLAALVEEHGADATVTVQGLSAGLYARYQDRVQRQREQSTQESLPGYGANVFVACGLVEAPFLNVDADTEAERIDATLAAVADLPPGARDWLQARINDLTEADEGNWTGWRERRQGSTSD